MGNAPHFERGQTLTLRASRRTEGLALTDDGFAICSLWRSWSCAWTKVAEFGVFSVRVRWTTVSQVGVRLAPGVRCGGWQRRATRALIGFDDSLTNTYGLKAEELAVFLERVRMERTGRAARAV